MLKCVFEQKLYCSLTVTTSSKCFHEVKSNLLSTGRDSEHLDLQWNWIPLNAPEPTLSIIHLQSLSPVLHLNLDRELYKLTTANW